MGYFFKVIEIGLRTHSTLYSNDYTLIRKIWFFMSYGKLFVVIDIQKRLLRPKHPDVWKRQNKWQHRDHGFCYRPFTSPSCIDKCLTYLSHLKYSVMFWLPKKMNFPVRSEEIFTEFNMRNRVETLCNLKVCMSFTL